MNIVFLEYDFPLYNIDKIINLTIGYEMHSIMVGFSSYNKIQVACEDHHKSYFIKPWENFFYHVMSFIVKNVRETY